MAVKVSIGVKEEAALRAVVERTVRECPERKTLDGLLAKIDAAKVKRAEPKDQGLGWKALRDALTSSLGSRLAMPPAPDASWYSTMNGRIKRVGLDAEGAAAIAEFLTTWRRPTIAFEYVVNNITDLLAASRRPRGNTVGGGSGGAGGAGWGLTEFDPSDGAGANTWERGGRADPWGE